MSKVLAFGPGKRAKEHGHPPARDRSCLVVEYGKTEVLYVDASPAYERGPIVLAKGHRVEFDAWYSHDLKTPPVKVAEIIYQHARRLGATPEAIEILRRFVDIPENEEKKMTVIAESNKPSFAQPSPVSKKTVSEAKPPKAAAEIKSDAPVKTTAPKAAPKATEPAPKQLEASPAAVTLPKEITRAVTDAEKGVAAAQKTRDRSIAAAQRNVDAATKARDKLATKKMDEKQRAAELKARDKSIAALQKDLAAVTREHDRAVATAEKALAAALKARDKALVQATKASAAKSVLEKAPKSAPKAPEAPDPKEINIGDYTRGLLLAGLDNKTVGAELLRRFPDKTSAPTNVAKYRKKLVDEGKLSA